MEMTIDDNVDFLNEAKKLFEDIANDPSINETIKTYFIIESLESAIGIMRKYQKIKEQVDIAIDKENFAISGSRLIQIREIINGNVD